MQQRRRAPTPLASGARRAQLAAGAVRFALRSSSPRRTWCGPCGRPGVVPCLRRARALGPAPMGPQYWLDKDGAGTGSCPAYPHGQATMALPRVFRCSDRDTDLGTPIYWLARKNTLQRTETTRAYRRAALARCLSGALLNVLSPAPTGGGGGEPCPALL